MKIYKLKHYGTAPIPESNHLTQNLKNPYHPDYCPGGRFNSKHSLWDYTYWGHTGPSCQFCGYEDKTRILD